MEHSNCFIENLLLVWEFSKMKKKSGLRLYLAAQIICLFSLRFSYNMLKIVSEYDQEIPQSQTADNAVAPRGRATQPLRDTRKTNQAKQSALSSTTR